jgi:hypothetical protein
MNIKTVALLYPGNMGSTIGAAGFHLAAAEICQRLTPFKDQTDPAPALAAVVDTIRGGSQKPC